jgi:hypothetical protein
MDRSSLDPVRRDIPDETIGVRVGHFKHMDFAFVSVALLIVVLLLNKRIKIVRERITALEREVFERRKS